MNTDSKRSPLTLELIRRIGQRGPITFAEFMEAALYHPLHGYYVREGGPWNRSRDFVTNVDMGWGFAAMAARLVKILWGAAGSPQSYALVDAGGGDGTLCRRVQSVAAAETGSDRGWAGALCGYLAERNASSECHPAGFETEAAAHADRSPPPLRRVVFPSADDRILFGEACILANELIDALPVHLVRRRKETLEEACVDVDAEQRFRYCWTIPSTPALEAYFEFVKVMPPQDRIVPVNLQAGRWLREASASFQTGHLVIIDYGYPAAALFSPIFAAEPLRTFSGGAPGGDPLADPGSQDITAAVDFTALALGAEAAGLKVLCLTEQYRLMQQLAIHFENGDVAAYLAGIPAFRDSGPLGKVRAGLALRSLFSPEGMGGAFRVLVLSRGACDVPVLFRKLRSRP